MPLIVAILGNAVIFLGFYFSAGISNKALRIGVRIASAIAGFSVVAYAPMVIEMSPEQAQSAAGYWFYILAIGAIASSLLNKKNKNP
jgi:hypothetical protein